MDEAGAALKALGQVGVRQVDGVLDCSLFKVIGYLDSRHCGAILFALGGGCAEVRYRRHAVNAYLSVGREIGHICRRLAAAEGCDQRVGVDQLASCEVENAYAVLHLGYRLAVYHASCRVVEGQVESNIITRRIQLIKA